MYAFLIFKYEITWKIHICTYEKLASYPMLSWLKLGLKKTRKCFTELWSLHRSTQWELRRNWIYSYIEQWDFIILYQSPVVVRATVYWDRHLGACAWLMEGVNTFTGMEGRSTGKGREGKGSGSGKGVVSRIWSKADGRITELYWIEVTRPAFCVRPY